MKRFAEIPAVPFIDRAACRDFPDVDFHPTRPTAAAPAVAICRQCLAQSDCLAYALEHQEDQGVWGGLTEWERDDLQPRRRLR